MSSHTMTMNSNSKFDEHRWVIHVRQMLEEELEDDYGVPVCIFSVPKNLMCSNPDSYIPQQVALGPYHYRRPELHEMERYKLDAAKRIQKQLQNHKFRDLVDHLMKLEPRIRACYHKYLDFNSETLVWMMAIDASFLLEFLQIYATKEGKVLTCILSKMSHLIDYLGRKSAHNVILRDIVMLENQIPLFLLRMILELQYPSSELAKDVLQSMLMGLFKDLSPLKMMEGFSEIQVTESAHLLDFMYHMIVPKAEELSETNEVDDGNESISSSHGKKLFNEICKFVSKLKGVLVSRPVRLLLKLPWTIITQLPVYLILKQASDHLFFSQNTEDNKPEILESSSTNMNKPPLVEEIMIPSVIELYKSGVRFLPTNGGIASINFDVKTITFYLPTISLDVNTEVFLRNLVAYEASSASGLLVLARYTELMNGIIDSEEDAKLLRERGVVLNMLKSDGEVADLWNGMSKSVRLTKVPFLDKVIEDVNQYYHGRWKVRVGKLMNVYVFSSWQLLTFLAAILFFLLMTLQLFCSVHGCGRVVLVNNSH